MPAVITNVVGVNEKNELVAVAGTGSTNVTGYLSENCVPIDENGRMVIAGLGNVIVSNTAPSNSDGRPDGTVYIQTV